VSIIKQYTIRLQARATVKIWGIKMPRPKRLPRSAINA